MGIQALKNKNQYAHHLHQPKRSSRIK
jgi:hypothetical protein